MSEAQQNIQKKPVEKENYVRTLNNTNYFTDKTYKKDFLDSLVTCGLATFITKTILAPIQRWRIIKQTQFAYPKRPKKFQNIVNYFKRMPSEQGMSSFWRGNQANCWISFWQLFLQINIFDNLRANFKQIHLEFENDFIFKTFFKNIAEPLVASIASLLIIYPVDTARIRLTMNYFKNPSEILFKGIPSFIGNQRLEEGLKSVYRGYWLAVTISVFQLNFYLQARHLVSIYKNDSEENFIDALISKENIGSFASVLLIHPLDTLKKIVQLNNQNSPKIFNNVREAFSTLSKENSIFKLYNGISITAVRHILFAGLFSILYHEIEGQKEKHF